MRSRGMNTNYSGKSAKKVSYIPFSESVEIWVPEMPVLTNVTQLILRTNYTIIIYIVIYYMFYSIDIGFSRL